MIPFHQHDCSNCFLVAQFSNNFENRKIDIYLHSEGSGTESRYHAVKRHGPGADWTAVSIGVGTPQFARGQADSYHWEMALALHVVADYLEGAWKPATLVCAVCSKPIREGLVVCGGGMTSCWKVYISQQKPKSIRERLLELKESR